MQRPRRDVEHITLFHRHLPHLVQQRVVFDTLREFLTRDFLLKAIDELRVRRGLDDVPHLRLARLTLDALRILVIRMHLHREVVVGIDELDEDGRQLLPHCRKVIRQRLARRRAIHDDARAVGMHGHLPALRDLIEIAGLAVLLPQPVAAPDIVLQGRFQFQRVKFHTIIFS